MEDQDGLLDFVPTTSWRWLQRVVTQEELFNVRGSVHVYGAANVTPIILVIEAAVDNLVRSDLIIINAPH